MDIEPQFSPEEQGMLEGDQSQNTLVEQPPQTPREKVPLEQNGEKNAQKTSHMVPHGALHAEREERKKAQADAALAHAKLARMQERFKIARELAERPENSALLQNTPQNDAIPDPEKDFVAYVKWIGGQLQQQQANAYEEKRKQQQRIEEDQQQQTINDYFATSITAVKADIPDFDEAADFLYDLRVKQLKMLQEAYPDFADQKAIDAQIGSELNALVSGAIKAGTNPAQLIYNYAKNAGFAAKTPPLNANFDALRAKHCAAKTLTSSNGRPIEDQLGLEAIDQMSDREFAEWIANPRNEKAFNLLMRGE